MAKEMAAREKVKEKEINEEAIMEVTPQRAGALSAEESIGPQSAIKTPSIREGGRPIRESRGVISRRR